MRRDWKKLFHILTILLNRWYNRVQLNVPKLFFRGGGGLDEGKKTPLVRFVVPGGGVGEGHCTR